MYNVDKVLGLFSKTYDYHEWSNVIAVSGDKATLLEYYKDMKLETPLLEEADAIYAEEYDRDHFTIEEIPYITSQKEVPDV